MITYGILLIILLISLITDIKNRKILNIVTFPAMLAGLLINVISGGWDGFLMSSLGLLTGLGLLIFPYLLRGIAAGDVKLLMAIGALKGPAFVFYSFICIAIVGGIIAVILLFSRHELFSTLKRIMLTARLKTFDGISKEEFHHAFPYGVAIVIGTACYSVVKLL